MADNLTGLNPNEGDRTPWSPAAGASELPQNNGLSEGELSLNNEMPLGNYGDPTTQELDTLDSQAGVANEYTDKLSGVVTQAKDYLGEKVGTVGTKIKEFATDDLSGMANKAKDFARQNPGQAILVSAAAGLLLGLFVRARR